ncbi:MAG: hypothetical protein ACOYCB_12915 [Fastidiosipilaceae bacterium]|jgi:hypothetical protein
MITIKRTNISVSQGRARMTAGLLVDGTDHELWFEVEEKYEKFLCPERADAFVLGLLYYGMKYGHDISSEIPMTDILYERLTDQFLVPFYKLNRMSDDPKETRNGVGYRVKITCPVAAEVTHPAGGDKVGTGISCGVDSLHVFATHKDISCACIWKGHTTTGIQSMDSAEAREEAWNGMLSRSKAFAAQVGIPLLSATTNFDRECLPGLQWDGMTTYGNLFCIFALQKLWKKYYIASNCDIMDFNMKMVSLKADPARYEYFLFPFLSLPHFTVMMDGQSHSRLDKVRNLMGYAPAKKFLNVCWRVNEDHKNGTNDCPKCMITLLELDVVGRVDEFKGVFDVDYYHANFHEFLAEYYRCFLHKNIFALELKPYMSKLRIPLKTRMRAYKIVAAKMFSKALRLGKVRTSGFSAKA